VVVISCHSEGARELERQVDRLYVIRASPFPGGNVGEFDVAPFRAAVEKIVPALGAALLIAEYAWLAPAMQRVPRGTRRLVDCHDVLHQRTARFTAAGVDPWVRCTEREERALLGHADVVLAIQQGEAEVFRQLIPGKRVACLLPHFDPPPEYSSLSSVSPIILTVGSRHGGNEGIRKFANQVWPLVRQACPRARLQIAGAIGDDLPPRDGVDCLGEIPDLTDCYRNAAVVVCPIEVGTGLKIKMAEAIRFGKAVVATPAAAEGLPAASPPPWMAASSVEASGWAVTSLLADPGERQRLERLALAYGEEHFSLARFLAGLRALVPPADGPHGFTARKELPEW
jgi:succinoglycan biosynthesis protein ExoO